MPNSGDCSLASFNNDLKVDSHIRTHYCKAIIFKCSQCNKAGKSFYQKQSASTVTGPYNVSFDYGGSVVTETANTTINAGASTTYTFTGTYPIPSAGYQYNFKAWVTKTGDNNHLNDTAYKTVKYINNDAITSCHLPKILKQCLQQNLLTAEMAIGGNKYLDFGASSNQGKGKDFCKYRLCIKRKQCTYT